MARGVTGCTPRATGALQMLVALPIPCPKGADDTRCTRTMSSLPMTAAPPADRTAAKPRFRLARHFALISLLGVLATTWALVWALGRLTEQRLVDHEGRANAELTQLFANTTWDRYREFVLGSASRRAEELRRDPAQAQLHAEVLARMGGLHIAKVKVYNLSGTTVFSTDPGQVGENKATNEGFRAARDGQPVSQITHRDRFDTFEGQVEDRDLIASYIPVRASPGGPVEGVFEVYSDVTALLAQQRRAQWDIALLAMGLGGALYVFLALVVRRADGIIATQECERAEREAAVWHLANHDVLTGLPNRARFTEELACAVSRAERTQQSCALLFVDLDRFKIVNDSLGHEAGDQLLKAVAERLSGCLRASDRVFRMGGDEFTAILPEVDAAEDAAFVARRMHEQLAQPMTVRGHALEIGATIGIAVFPGDGRTAEELLRHADAAMYLAKEAGRGGYAFYTPQMNERAAQRVALDMAVRHGFREGEFALAYQPVVDAATQRIGGVEALLRWHSPARGTLLPADFLGALEGSGMMPIVGEWVLRTACLQAVAWRRAGLPPLRMAVNVSASQLGNPGFVGTVQRVLAESGVSPGLLDLEASEHAMASLGDRAPALACDLRALGLRLVVDDFGRGASSLQMLRDATVDGIKLDQRLVRALPDSQRDRALLAALGGLSRELGVSMGACGVETAAQARCLEAGGCTTLQGWLHGQALQADQLESAVRTSLQPGPGAVPPRGALRPA